MLYIETNSSFILCQHTLFSPCIHTSVISFTSLISSRDAASVVGQRFEVVHGLQSISSGIQAHNRSISLQACYGVVGDDAIDGLRPRPLELNGLECGVSDVDSQGGRRET